MAQQSQVSDKEAGAGEIRGKLITRLAMAGGLVAVLLGVLAFFDYLATVPDQAEVQVFTKPVPVAPKKEISLPVTPAANLPEPPQPEKLAPAPEAPPPPVVENQVPPVVEARPEAHVENRPLKPSTAAVVKTVPPQAAVPAPAPVPEGTSAPSSPLPTPRPAQPADAAPARPSARLVETRPAPVVTPPVVSRLFSGFLLQAGVFSSVQRAEELHARLTLSGVPSTLETRVQVGPFRTRQEAEAAQAKLKELGVEAILIPPRGKN